MPHASELIVYDDRTEVARHERLLAKGAGRLELDHYLEVLIRKPGALPGATALELAKAAGKFTPTPERLGHHPPAPAPDRTTLPFPSIAPRSRPRP